MKIRNIFNLFLVVGLLFFKIGYAGNLKEVGEGKYILENEYFEIELNSSKGGGIENILYKPSRANLVGSLPGVKKGIAFEDRIYFQRSEGEAKIMDVEYFVEYPYSSKILKEKGKEVSIEVSSEGLSDFFSGLKVSKVYTLKDGVPAIFVEHKLENQSESSLKAGIWSTNFFRVSGGLPERNKFFTPALEGLEEVLHPGKGALPDGN
jgi:hypothetical protein